MGMQDFKVIGNLGKGAFAAVTKVSPIYRLVKQKKDLLLVKRPVPLACLSNTFEYLNALLTVSV